MRIAAAFCLFALLAGCASTSQPVTERYNALSNETTYRTRAISLGALFEGHGIDSGMRVDLEARASCPGEQCTPDLVWLSFEAVNPKTNIQIGNSAVTMRADEQLYRWTEREGKLAEQDVTYVRGTFVRVRLTLPELRQVATAEHVAGTVGPESFSLSYDDRMPLRRLLTLAEGANGAS